MKNCTSFINIQCYRIGYRKCLPIILSILFLVSGAMAQSSKTAYEKLSDTKKEEIQGMLKYYDKQIYFNENRGQWPSNVLYKADFHLGQALVTPDGMMVGTFDPVSAAAISAAGIQEEIDIQNGLRKHLPRSSPRGHGWLMKFLNSSPEMTIESKHKHADVFNYFMGNKSNANTNNYQEVWYNNVYNNVDVRYYPSEEGTLEYDIVCKPGFDKENIAIQMKGIDEVVINKNGHLVLKTSVGDVDFPAPVAYQLINGKQQSVEANYRVSDKNIVHFNLGKYNPALPLIIDPIALRWATWVSTNSTGDNHGHCIWVDQSDGAIYVVARVDGSTNRITVGALDTTAAGGIDMIVGKYLEPANVGGTGTRVWQTYIGGSGNDNPYAMEQGPDGNLYITGYTSSSDFPLTSNGSIFGGSYLDQSSQTTDNIFITKITKTGTSIKSAVVGGNGDDGSFDLRIAKTGEITVCGNTKSTNLATLYPGTGASNTNHSGIDALVFKINQDLSSIIWMKNNGGSKDDQPTILSQDPRDGSIYIGGYTASTNFPVMNARQSTQSNTNNTRSGFLTKLKSTGDTVWSSYFRSAPGKQTSILCMELDTLNNKIYFGGITEGLDTSNIHAGTYDNSYGGGSNDFFVSRIDTNQSNVISTYLGGSGNEVNMMGLNIDQNKDVYIFGYTNSSNFPVSTSPNIPLQSTNLGNNDKVFVKLNSSLSSLLYSTYYGGAGDDYDPVGERGIKFSNCRIYTIVTSQSNDIPLTRGALDTARISTTPYEPGLVVWANPPDLLGNTILGNQTICAGQTPGDLMGSTPAYVLPTILRNGVPSSHPSLGSAATYQWQISNDSIVWNSIPAPGGTQQNLSGVTIGSLYTKTFFRRIIGGDACILAGVANQVITVDFPHSTANISICEGGSYTPPGGIEMTETGTQVTMVKNAANCDSSITTNLTVKPKTTSSQTVTACEHYLWNGVDYTTSGDRSITVPNADLCDSTATLHLTITHTSTSTASATACDSYTWSANGQTYTESGTYTATSLNAGGCAHTSTLELTVNYSSSSTESATACDSYTWTVNGLTYTQSGTYTSSSTNAGGCPHTCNLTLTINQSSTSTSSATACDSYTWATNGQTYTESGTYTSTSVNASGCTRSSTLNLTINNSSTSSASATACNSYTWTANGHTYTASGTYTTTSLNASGCILTKTLNLTINHSTSSSESATACDSYTWAVNNQTYTSSGTHTSTSLNAAGCTHTITLNLTINHASSQTESNVSGCDSYDLPWDGAVTSSDDYSHTYYNINGCDSTVILHVTINPSYNITADAVIACDSYTLPWEPETLATATGDYSHHYNSIKNCDSLVTIHVTINHSNVPTEYSVIRCNSYNLPWDGPVTASGNYPHTYHNISGCDSLVTAHVTIHYSSIPTEFSITKCDSYDLPWGGTATTTDDYSNTYTNISGCDSIVTAHVTINQSYNPIIPAAICQNDSYSLPWGGSANTADDYTYVYTSAGGCDSTVTIRLTVNPLPNINLTIDASLDCNTGLAQLSGSSSTSGATLLWVATNGGHIQSGETTGTPVVNAAGTYTLTVTDPVTGCHVSDVTLVTPCEQIPNCLIYGDTLICQGQSTTLCAAAGYTSYYWSTGATCRCITVNCAGNYCVTVTTAGGGNISCCQHVTVIPKPSCNISGNTSICEGQSTTLSAPLGAGTYHWNTGATTRSITVSSAGIYCVTVTNANGCASSCSVCVRSYPAPVCSISGNSTICPGQLTSLCAPSSCGSYLWSTGATTRCITINAGGTYIVTVTNNNGCSSSCSKTITVNQPLSCNITGCDNSICQGQTVSLCAPSGCVSYLWSTGATTRCINVTTAGTFSVTITNNSGCISTCSKTIIVSQPPSCNISGCDNSICQGQTAHINAPAGYDSYLWSTGATTRGIDVTSAGTYTVTVTNSSGCSSSCSKTITVSQPPLCSISGCDHALCEGQSDNISAPSGYASYAWSTGATTRTISVSTAGTYSVTVTNQSGCSSSCSKTITVNPLPSCSILGSGTIVCQGQPADFCAVAGYSSYLWNTGATSQCISLSLAGTYSVTVTNSNGCISNCIQTITAAEPPSCIITGGDDPICYGETANISAQAGYDGYLWSTGATTNNINVSSAGTYTVTVTNSNGCTSTCSKTITISPLPLCSISGCEQELCSGQTDHLSAPVGYDSYAWSTGATTRSINVSSAGTYTVTVTNSNGCSSTCNKTITVSEPPSCNITGCDHSLCQGQSEQISAPAGYVSYLWNTGATTRSITVSSAGTYSVTVMNSSGCTSTCSKNITMASLPSCNVAGCDHELCPGQSENISAPVGYDSYAWSTGATTRNISVSAAGTYTVTVTNSNGCTSTCSKTITMSQLPSCNILGNGTVICQGQPASFCAQSGYASYQWSTGATSRCINISLAGTYLVTVTSDHGCTSTCSQTITAAEPPSCEISGCGNSICQGQLVNLHAAAGYASYLWSTGATTRGITVSTAGTYTVTVTNSNGCSSSCSKTITVSTTPVCNISGDASICHGSSTVLSAPAGLAGYLWNNGATTRSITVNCAGTYTVTVTNSSGCSSTCSKTVTVTTSPSSAICGDHSICQGQSTTLCAPAGCVSYYWNTGATTRCINAHCAGTYSVTVTNAAGCSSTSSICVTVSAPPSSVICGDLLICQGHSTTLCAPAGCASYHWSNGANTRCINVTCAGTYSVTVTNTAGCSSTSHVCVTVSPAPNSNICGNHSICQGQSTTLCASAGCVSYHWNTGAHTRCINVHSGGTYSVTVTNAAGCSSTSSICVTVSAPPSSTITGDLSICQGQSTILSAPPGGASYHWNTGATTRHIQVHCAGTYSVTATNSAGCSSTSHVCVTLSAPPSSTISGNTHISFRQCSILCAPDGCVSYLWNTGATTRCIIISSPGIYSVTVTNASGCYSTSSVCVTRPGCHDDGDDDSDNDHHHSSHGSYDSRHASPVHNAASIEAIAYPNPFNSTTTIQFRNTGEKVKIVVEIYNLDGAKIAELFVAEAETNELYKVEWNAGTLPNGLYMYRIVCGDKVVTGRLILDK